MSNRQRAALLLGAVVVLVAAFVALRPSDDEPSTTADTITVAPATTTAPAATTPTTIATTAPKPRPKGPLLTAAKVTEIEVEKGDTVRFRARSQSDDEVHVHGYDISKDAPAGKTISMSFPANLEGIFEVEFETAGTEIARLTVNP